MKKFLVLFAVTALAVTALGVGYALWSTTLTIDGTVSTGNVDARWSVGDQWVEEAKDVSRIICEGAGTTELAVTIENAYPSAHYYCELDIHSIGSVPVHIGNVVIDSELRASSTVEILPHSTLVPPIRCSQQLHEGQVAYGLLHVHLSNANPQGGTLRFESTINVNQYNDAEVCELEMIEHFENSEAEVTINTPLGSETVELEGPTTVIVRTGDLAPKDPPEREHIDTEIVSMELSGVSATLGPITIRVRDPVGSPDQRSIGEIEELENVEKGRLDLPPFAPSGTATSFFDVFFEIEAPNAPPGLQLLHNNTPKHMTATITHVPPAEGETYENLDEIHLFDEDENPTGITIVRVIHTPHPPP
jgi:hypothetical protein